MFYYEILWIYQNFKSENLFFYLYLFHAARILDLSLEVMLSPPKWRKKHLYNSKGFSFMLKRGLNNKEIQLNLSNLFPTFIFKELYLFT